MNDIKYRMIGVTAKQKRYLFAIYENEYIANDTIQYITNRRFNALKDLAQLVKRELLEKRIQNDIPWWTMTRYGRMAVQKERGELYQWSTRDKIVIPKKSHDMNANTHFALMHEGKVTNIVGNRQANLDFKKQVPEQTTYSV